MKRGKAEKIKKIEAEGSLGCYLTFLEFLTD